MMDCCGCSEGLMCDANTSACVAGPPLVPVPNVSNATLEPPLPPLPPPPPPLPTAPPCPACATCPACPPCNASNATANATPMVVPKSPPPPPPPANGTGPTLIEQLTPGLLERLRGVFADAAAESLHDYPVDKAAA